MELSEIPRWLIFLAGTLLGLLLGALMGILARTGECPKCHTSLSIRKTGRTKDGWTEDIECMQCRTKYHRYVSIGETSLVTGVWKAYGF